MEPLFRTTTKYTFEEYKRFNISLMKKNGAFVVAIIFEVLFFLFFILLTDWLYLIIAIIYPLILIFSQNLAIKRIYNSNKIVQDMNVEFEFYDNEFIVKEKLGESKLEYSMLHKIYETPTNFYLMISKNQGYMLNKANFPSGLNEFLKGVEKNKN